MKPVGVGVLRLLGLSARAEPRDGQQSAAELVHLHYRPVWRLLRRMGLSPDEADDAAQEVFLVVARKIERITPGSERAFVIGTAINKASKVRSSRARQRATLTTEQHEPQSAAEHRPDELLDQQRRRDLLDRVLDSMHADLRVVFVLYEIEQWTMAEIAEQLALAAGTVASRLRRARQDFETRARELSNNERKGAEP